MEIAGQEGDPAGEIWDLRLDEERSFIYLRIDPWTTQKDLQELWQGIEAERKKLYGPPWKKRHTFEQALCFWDLHTQPEFGKLSHGKICQSWHDTFHDQEDPPRATVQSAIKRMQHLIDQLTPQG
jgi:hypothetical protein